MPQMQQRLMKTWEHVRAVVVRSAMTMRRQMQRIAAQWAMVLQHWLAR
jgi:hypothetical protein